MEFKQLMLITDDSVISTEEKAFLHCHKEIIFNGNMAADFIYRMTLNLSEMNEKKLYIAAGFESFGEYTKKAIGINERQAYNYMKILNKFGEDGLQLNAKLGVTKLALIASANEEVREEILKKNSEDLESITVKELKEKITELSDELNSKEEQISLLENTTRITIENTEEVEQAKAEVKKVKFELEEAEADVKDAEERIKDEYKKAEEALKKIYKLEADKKALDAEIEKLKNAPPAEDKQSAEKIAAKETELSEKKKEIETLNKKLLIASDTNMTKFKFMFEQLQKLGSDMLEVINIMDNEKAEKCRKALKTVVESWL
jgi:chromosome segregation ATPase